MKRHSHVTGNAGLYYACYRLSRLGWNAIPTSRNARGIDILLYDAHCKKKLGIQVKALSKRSPVPLGKSISGLMGDFWLIINNISVEPVVYVMLPSEVRRRAHRGVKNGKVSYWLQPRSYETQRFHEAWPRIGKS